MLIAVELYTPLTLNIAWHSLIFLEPNKDMVISFFKQDTVVHHLVVKCV